VANWYKVRQTITVVSTSWYSKRCSTFHPTHNSRQLRCKKEEEKKRTLCCWQGWSRSEVWTNLKPELTGYKPFGSLQTSKQLFLLLVSYQPWPSSPPPRSLTQIPYSTRPNDDELAQGYESLYTNDEKRTWLVYPPCNDSHIRNRIIRKYNKIKKAWLTNVDDNSRTKKNK